MSPIDTIIGRVEIQFLFSRFVLKYWWRIEQFFHAANCTEQKKIQPKVWIFRLSDNDEKFPYFTSEKKEEEEVWLIEL